MPQQYSGQHEQTGSDAHLPFQADHARPAAFHRQTGFAPCEGAAFNDDRVFKPGH